MVRAVYVWINGPTIWELNLDVIATAGEISQSKYGTLCLFPLFRLDCKTNLGRKVFSNRLCATTRLQHFHLWSHRMNDVCTVAMWWLSTNFLVRVGNRWIYLSEEERSSTFAKLCEARRSGFQAEATPSEAKTFRMASSLEQILKIHVWHQ